MTRKLIIDDTLGYIRAALIEDGTLCEIHMERQSAQEQAESLYMGRIQSIKPALHAAFVDIGTPLNAFLPMDDDMILHVAPASAGAPVTHLAKAFLVPKHTLVKMNAAIWHLAPLPANKDQLTAMIILPECTYANDCTVVDLSPEEQFEIVMA